MKVAILIATVFTSVIFLLTNSFPFYWDNVIQISVPANFYFNKGFSEIFLPSEIATGHPTFIGMYFAASWKLLGKSLMVTHLVMMPFIFGLIYQLVRLIQNLKIKAFWTAVLMLVLVSLDTTFLAQASLVSFDAIQVFIFLFCLNQLILKRSNLLAIGFTTLMLISLRGALIGFGLILSHFLIINSGKRLKWKSYWSFIPGLTGLIIFLIIFYQSQGWVIHNTISNNWAATQESVTLMRIFKNFLVLGWQITDFGRIAIFILLFYLIIRWFKNWKFEDNIIRYLAIVSFGQLLIIGPIVVFSNIQFGHRYFLPFIIPVVLLVAYWLMSHSSWKYNKAIGVSFVFLLISGHFWIYPQKVSQGWDSTTLHWQYFDVSERMYEYISNEGIPFHEVGTFFPAYKSRKLMHLESNNISYQKFDS